MVKVTLSVLCLGAMILGTAASNDPDHSDLECAVDGSKAFNDAADAAIFIWAATQRCDFAKQPAPVAPVVTAAPVPVTTAAPAAPAATAAPVATTGRRRRKSSATTAAPRKLSPTTPPNAVRCTIDISSAVSAVGGMINIIVEALDKCDIIHSDGEGCGEAAGKLTAAAAGLVAGASGVINSCPNAFQPSTKEKIPAHLEKTTHLGKCVIDAKGSLAGTFDAMQSLKNIGGRRRRKTLHNALNTVSAFSSLGSAVAAAVNDCSAYENNLGNHQADCSSYILGLVSQLNNIADIASDMADECKVSASRLYLEDAEDEKKYTNTVTSNSMSLALAAFLPVTAVFGFILGRRFGNFRSNREFDSMMQVELE